MVTRYEDVVWLTRHHEYFSSQVFKNDPRPAYPEEDQFEYQPSVTFRSLKSLPVTLNEGGAHGGKA